MAKYLSPTGIQETYQIGRSTAYKVLRDFEEHGGEVIHIGKLTRANEAELTEFLKRRSNEKNI